MTPSAAQRSVGATTAGAAVIAAAIAWIYAPVLRGDWLWDDAGEIVQNPVLRTAGALGRIWRGESGPDYFPLKTSLQWLQWQLWQDHVLGYHLTNVALHLLAALLVWRLGVKLGTGGAAGWLAGLWFAVHPVAVESVAWISELKNTLSLPLALAAVLSYLDYDRSARRSAYAWALAAFTAALLAKTSVAGLPLILLGCAWWRRGRVGLRDLWASAPFFAVALFLGLVTIRFQDVRVMAHQPLPALSLGLRFAGAGRALGFYLGHCLWPAPLLPIYPAWPAGDPGAARYFPALVLAVAVLACWRRRATWGRPVLLALGAFVVSLAPALGLVPMAFLRIAPVSDHLCYAALVSLALLGAAAVGAGPRWLSAATASAALLAAVALAAESRAYAKQFVNEETLWTYTLARNPEAWLAHNNLGIIYGRSGRLAAAIAEGEAAVRLRPDFPEARSNLGLSLTRAGRLPEAMAELRAAVRLAPAFPGAHLNLGRALLLAGQLREAIAELTAAQELDPDLPEARTDLAVAHTNLGNALARAGQLPEAVAEFGRALEWNPANPGTHRSLAAALAALGRIDEAQAEAATAARLQGRP